MALVKISFTGEALQERHLLTRELIPGNFSGNEHDDESRGADRRQDGSEERQAAAVGQRRQLEARVHLGNDQKAKKIYPVEDKQIDNGAILSQHSFHVRHAQGFRSK